MTDTTRRTFLAWLGGAFTAALAGLGLAPRRSDYVQNYLDGLKIHYSTDYGATRMDEGIVHILHSPRQEGKSRLTVEHLRATRAQLCANPPLVGPDAAGNYRLTKL